MLHTRETLMLWKTHLPPRRPVIPHRTFHNYVARITAGLRHWGTRNTESSFLAGSGAWQGFLEEMIVELNLER